MEEVWENVQRTRRRWKYKPQAMELIPPPLPSFFSSSPFTPSPFLPLSLLLLTSSHHPLHLCDKHRNWLQNQGDVAHTHTVALPHLPNPSPYNSQDEFFFPKQLILITSFEPKWLPNGPQGRVCQLSHVPHLWALKKKKKKKAPFDVLNEHMLFMS